MILGRILKLLISASDTSPSTSMVITASPPFGAGEAEISDVDLGIGHEVGHRRNGARLVIVEHQQGVVLPREGDCHPVDLRDQDVAASDGGPLNHGGAPLGSGHGDPRGVGVGARDLSLMESKLHAVLLRQLEGMADPLVIRVHPHHAGNEGLVRAVAPVSLGKGTGQRDVRLYHLVPRIFHATRPRRTAPAVWELDGPIITGPMMSNTFIEASSGQGIIMPWTAYG